MDWDNVRVFLAVARGGQFVAAAKRLRLDNATVSRRIAALDATLATMRRISLRDAINIPILIARQSSWTFAIMPAITIRNLSHETHRALKLRAAKHGRSAEAEMRVILEAAVRPADRVRLGGALVDMSRKIGLTNADVEALEQTHDRKKAAEPLGFE
jgi:plasmid stability protein